MEIPVLKGNTVTQNLHENVAKKSKPGRLDGDLSLFSKLEIVITINK